MESSTIHKVKQTESFLEYEIWNGSETAGRYLYFFSFLLLLLLSVLGVVELFNRGIQKNNILQEFMNPLALVVLVSFCFFLVMVIISINAYKSPYLIVLDAESELVKYRTFFNIRLKKMHLSKLKSFSLVTYERKSKNMYEYQKDKTVGNAKIFFNGNDFINRIRIEDLRGITLKEWIIFLKDINTFITTNFGPEYNFQSQIEKFNTYQGAEWIRISFKYPKST